MDSDSDIDDMFDQILQKAATEVKHIYDDAKDKQNVSN